MIKTKYKLGQTIEYNYDRDVIYAGQIVLIDYQDFKLNRNDSQHYLMRHFEKLKIGNELHNGANSTLTAIKETEDLQKEWSDYIQLDDVPDDEWTYSWLCDDEIRLHRTEKLELL